MTRYIIVKMGVGLTNTEKEIFKDGCIKGFILGILFSIIVTVFATYLIITT